jgi:hypothetical protein
MTRLCGLALALALLSCGGDSTGPVIDMLDPPSGARGSQVEILGDRFCGDEADAADAEGVCASPPNGLVSFGDDMDPIRATVQAWRHQSITVEVPASAPVGPNLVTVTVNGVESNPVDFEVSN